MQRDDTFLTWVARVAQEVAAHHADDVDKQGRYPQEAIDALKEIGAVGACMPEESGGPGVSLDAIAHACLELSRRCASHGDDLRDASHPVADDRAAPGRSARWFEGYCARSSPNSE